jgi:hypothetical protein
MFLICSGLSSEPNSVGIQSEAFKKCIVIPAKAEIHYLNVKFTQHVQMKTMGPVMDSRCPKSSLS